MLNIIARHTLVDPQDPLMFKCCFTNIKKSFCCCSRSLFGDFQLTFQKMRHPLGLFVFFRCFFFFFPPSLSFESFVFLSLFFVKATDKLATPIQDVWRWRSEGSLQQGLFLNVTVWLKGFLFSLVFLFWNKLNHQQEIKKIAKPKFAAEPEKYYPVTTMTKLGFSRYKCEKCGEYFWRHNDSIKVSFFSDNMR